MRRWQCVGSATRIAATQQPKGVSNASRRLLRRGRPSGPPSQARNRQETRVLGQGRLAGCKLDEGAPCREEGVRKAPRRRRINGGSSWGAEQLLNLM